MEKRRTVNFVYEMPAKVIVVKNVPAPYDDWDEAAAAYHQSYAKLGSYGVATHGYGIADMNYYGKFVNAGDCGRIWRPYFASATWDPFANGSWVYYPNGGYSWVSPYPWGWTPYHYGRWQYCSPYGWGWRPYGTWRSIQNPPRYPRSAPRLPPRYPLVPIPRPPAQPSGTPTVITVNHRPPAASGVNNTNHFMVRRDSAGLGVPRETLGNLSHISNHMDQRGVESMAVHSPAFGGVNAPEHGSTVASARGPGESTRSASYGSRNPNSGGGGSHGGYSGGGSHSSYSGGGGGGGGHSGGWRRWWGRWRTAVDWQRSRWSPREHLYEVRLTSLPWLVELKLIVVTNGGVTASTEVIAVKRHTGVHASVIVCKNTIANQNLAYAA